MAPKKKEVQKLSLGDFLNDTSFGGAGGSWADEVEDTYGTQPLPPSERRGFGGSYGGGGYGGSSGGEHRGYSSLRDNLPQTLPDKPPFTAHLGNLSYDATTETVTEFFEGCNLSSVRIIEDREQQRPKGFAYAEFGDLEGLKQALTLDGQSFQGRSIRIKVADPPKERRDGGFESMRDMSTASWERKGPLPDIGGARSNERRGDRPDRPEFERRAPREFAEDNRRDLSNASWERKGPLSPLAREDRPAGSRDDSRPARGHDLGPRGGSHRDEAKQSPAASWGPGEGRQDSSRPPRREFTERPERPERPERAERAPTAAEKDMQWRSNMRPDAPAKEAPQSREGSEAPSSPAPAAAAPVGRPKLNLAKRTVSDAPDGRAAAAADSKASPFGAARPINTAAREREVGEKREQLIKEKKDADDKAREDRKLAKEAAAKEAEKAEADAADAAEAADAAKNDAEDAEGEKPAEAAETAETQDAEGNDATSQKIPTRPKAEGREPREPRDQVDNAKTRAAESGNWRQHSGEQRGSSRGGHVPRGPRGGGRGARSDERRPSRANGNGVPPTQGSQDGNADSAPPTPTVDADGWTTVTTVSKGRRGQSNRPIAS